MKITLIAAVLLIPLVGRSGELEKFYRDSHPETSRPSERSRTDAQAAAEEHEFTEIGLERVNAMWHILANTPGRLRPVR